MKYALLIYDEPGSHEALPPEELESVYGEYFALSEDPRCVGGAQLQPVETATSVRVRDGKALTTAGPARGPRPIPRHGWWLPAGTGRSTGSAGSGRSRRRPACWRSRRQPCTSSMTP